MGKYATLEEHKDSLENVVTLNSHKVTSEVGIKCIMYTTVEAVVLHLKQQVMQTLPSEEYLYNIPTRNKSPTCKGKGLWLKYEVMLDAVATANTIDETTYQGLR